jgi:hypothetical protein
VKNYYTILLPILIARCAYLCSKGLDFFGLSSGENNSINNFQFIPLNKNKNKHNIMNIYLKAGTFAGARKHSGGWFVALLIGCIAAVNSAQANTPVQNANNNLIVSSSAVADGTSGLVSIPSCSEATEQPRTTDNSGIHSARNFISCFISTFSGSNNVSNTASGSFLASDCSSHAFLLASGYSIKLLGNPSINMLLENYGSSERFQV